MPAVDDDILVIDDLVVSYGSQPAVRGAGLRVPRGRATALVGANGAGKTSTLLAIAGALPRSARVAGSIAFHPRGGGGAISLIPEQDKVFALLTVDENMRLVARRRRGGVGIDDAYAWFPRLAERRGSLAGNLSGGEQQMLALSMGLLGSPQLLLLDEPTLGLAVPIIEALCERLSHLRREIDVTLVVAEADATWVGEIADRAVVLDRGTVVAEVIGDLAAKRDSIQRMTLGLPGEAPA